MEEYLNVYKDGENIYYLNSKGREAVNCLKVRKKTTTIEHYLMRNYLYITLGCPANWRNEIQIINGKDKDKIICRTDALIDNSGAYTIIEVDNEQKMNENIKKIDRYRELIKRKAFGRFASVPKFIWITKTEYRRNELLKASEGLNVTVYLLSDFKNRGK
ncbi:replication-relaxation family protein [Mesobacillus foraminis]|uniref:Protein involved in plasmid replication-relaxation n=1 Tax=Mesobacillus foraminis TaxID=279826 RepID=A0A4R2BF89_9BACI|nr:replication-relaxation family protein [Mesobacillus foraminis]TCN25466.1 protein involved in plasmid replication-relaxation [Mesobacillus foraminis]